MQNHKASPTPKLEKFKQRAGRKSGNKTGAIHEQKNKLSTNKRQSKHQNNKTTNAGWRNRKMVPRNKTDEPTKSEGTKQA